MLVMAERAKHITVIEQTRLTTFPGQDTYVDALEKVYDV